MSPCSTPCRLRPKGKSGGFWPALPAGQRSPRGQAGSSTWGGTAYDVESPEMVALHGEIAERLHGLLTLQDDRKLRLHVTVQNKVDRAAARTLQAELKAGFERREFRFRGFGLYAWEDGLWRPVGDYPFRG